MCVCVCVCLCVYVCVCVCACMCMNLCMCSHGLFTFADGFVFLCYYITDISIDMTIFVISSDI